MNTDSYKNGEDSDLGELLRLMDEGFENLIEGIRILPRELGLTVTGELNLLLGAFAMRWLEHLETMEKAGRAGLN